MSDKGKIIADFTSFSKEDFESAKYCALSGIYSDGLMRGSILCGGCKLFPMISEPYGLEHGKYNAPHLAFTVWAPYSETTKNLDRWHPDSPIAEFHDYLHFSNLELESMTYEDFQKELPHHISKFLKQEAGIGEISFSFNDHDNDFFRASGETGHLDSQSDALRYGRNLPAEYAEICRPSLEDKVRELGQTYNKRLIHEALPDGTFSSERDHKAWLAFCQKHDYAIVKRRENAPIPGVYVISAASDSPKWSNELPLYCGDQIDLARAEGLTTIDDMDGLNPGYVIDTKENREICEKVLQYTSSRDDFGALAEYMESSSKHHRTEESRSSNDEKLSKKAALARASESLSKALSVFFKECKQQGLSTIAAKREADKVFKDYFRPKAK